MKTFLILVELEYQDSEYMIRGIPNVLFNTVKADTEIEALKKAQALVTINSYFQDGKIDSFRIQEVV